ncbi:hypothetical protein C8F04DRAFT_1252860 [Mycena alexandri]|uniref:Uncharacterized protein n=1 Tax=Mycena alexandri TaxID=1745969 RepID=A0AAD6TAK9_9AGAR|nr:hypothetical protein C8F04DRAFT_1252860 [Mycena alexandri]
MDPQEIHVWEVALRGHENRVAALTIMMWDYLITLEDESRYGPPHQTCCEQSILYLSRTQPFKDVIRGCELKRGSEYLSHGPLKLRIYALYDTSPRIRALLIGAFSLEVLTAIVVFGVGSADNKVVAETMANIVRCNVTAIPSWLWVFWLAVTRQGVISSIYKGYRSVKSIGPQTLHHILVRDSVMFYLAIQVIYACNLAGWVKDPKTSLDLTTGVAIALPSVLSGRMLINVRHALYTPNALASPSDISLEEISIRPPDPPNADDDPNLIA